MRLTTGEAVNPLDSPPLASAWRWAVVVSTSPLQIRYDTQTDPLAAEPSTLVGALSIGQRVWCQLHGKRIIVIGVAGGSGGGGGGGDVIAGDGLGKSGDTIFAVGGTGIDVQPGGIRLDPGYTIPVGQLPVGTGSNQVAAGDHNHVISDVSGLQTALNGKANTVHTHAISDLITSGTPSTSTYLRGDGQWVTPPNTTYSLVSQAEAEAGTATASRVWSALRVSQAIAALESVKSVNGQTGVVSLNAADVGAAPTVHNHPISQVTGLQTALDGKAPTVHSHTIAQVTGLQTALDGKAPTVHGHALTDANITGILPIAQAPTPASGAATANQLVRGNDPRLSDSRTPTAHTHAAADIVSGTLALARIPTGTTGATVALGNHTHTPAQVGAAPASHTHAAGDITSGTLPIARGGTGSTTAKGARGTLGAAVPVANHNVPALTAGVWSADIAAADMWAAPIQVQVYEVAGGERVELDVRISPSGSGFQVRADVDVPVGTLVAYAEGFEK